MLRYLIARLGRVDVFGNGGIAPRILNLGSRRRSVVSFTPQPEFPVSLG
jgi:hypothetical protein